MEIHGDCDNRFFSVKEAFERNFTEHGDIGASFAATIDGEFVIDMWAGHRDRAKLCLGKGTPSSTCFRLPKP